MRTLGPIDAKKLSILREADAIVIEEMKAAKWYDKVWQAFAVLLPVRSVGVQGDERTYDFTCVLRVVESHDGMTADWVRLPHESARPHRLAHHQRSERHQPRRLRCLLQAAGDDRVGVTDAGDVCGWRLVFDKLRMTGLIKSC